MDLNQLECLLQYSGGANIFVQNRGIQVQLTEAKDQIIKTANYCSFYPESAQQIASMIENEFTQTRKDKKRIFLFLIHQIILDESQKKRQENPFLKAFGGKLKKLLGDFCIVDDIKDLESAYTMIKRWERDQIFHPQFIQKLRSILQPKYDQLKQQQETFNALNQTDASANKVLQHNIQTVQVWKLVYNNSKSNNHTKYISIFNSQQILIARLQNSIAIMISSTRRQHQIRTCRLLFKKVRCAESNQSRALFTCNNTILKWPSREKTYNLSLILKLNELPTILRNVKEDRLIQGKEERVVNNYIL